jgi:hypothetical protein
MEEDEYATRRQLYIEEGFAYSQLNLLKIIAASPHLGESTSGREGRLLTVLRVSQVLLLNELELIFLGYVVTQREWPHWEELLLNHSRRLKLSLGPGDSKELGLYLLLTGYLIKFYLNDELLWLHTELQRIMPDFKELFKSWGNKYGKKQMELNPKAINQFYASTIPKSSATHVISQNVSEIIDRIEELQKWD